jgi:two-component system, OmpR family, KDP operon response regulator KdpE
VSRVLVVDDEPQLLRALVLNLSNRGYEVTTADTGAAAIREATTRQFDLMLLDLGLPDIDGLDVLRRLRDPGPILPIVVLSARSGSTDKVVALDLGAVDYVTKPFDMNELVARLRSAMRRPSAPPAEVVRLGAVEVDLVARIVRRLTPEPPVTIHLTPTEWRMLEMLLRHPGTLVSARALLTALRGDPAHTDSSYLRIYMAQLRRKLELAQNRPRYLLTEPGMGYRFQP